MSKALADWGQAYRLFSQGLTLQEIADKLGCKLNTVKAQSARNGWTRQRTDTLATISADHAKNVKSQHLALKDRAEGWIEATVSDVERTVNALSKLKIPTSLHGLRKHEEVWGMHVKRGRQVFGLDNQAHSVNVSIGMVSLGDVMPADEPIVDVQTVADTGIEPVSNTPASP